MTGKGAGKFGMEYENCGNAAQNEAFQHYIIDFSLDWELFTERFPDYCITPVGFNQAVVYFRSEEPDGVFRGSEKDTRYNRVPKCYGLMATEELEELGVLRLQRFPNLALRGQGTLVGIIDTGIDLTSPLFQYEDGTTKVVALWDQEEESTEGTPEGFSYGREWTAAQIDQSLAQGRARKTSIGNRLPSDEENHGTILAAIAAGREQEDGFSGAAPDSELVIVRLKQAKRYLREFYSIPERVWACQEDDVIMGMRYVLAVAGRLNRPVAICLGIGTNMGGHGGTNSLARYISSASLVPGISVHIAGGNEGIASHHFRGAVPEDTPFVPVDFNVAEGENGFIMELWGSPPFRYSVALTSPGGESVDRISLKQDEFRSIRFFPEETVLEIRSFSGEAISGEQVIRMNFRKPAPGVWNLRVYADGNIPAVSGERAVFHLWMPITNFIGEATFFLRADPDTTITSPGDAVYSITYTPYDVTSDSLYLRASRGYTRDGRIKPDLAAPGVGVSLPSPIPGGRPIVRSGSSIAAAFGAGIGALMLEWAFTRGNDPTLNGQNMRFYLIQGAVRSGAYFYPNREWGYGIANIYDAFLAMR